MFRFLNAGEAILTIDKDLHSVNNLPTYKVNVYGRSVGIFDFFIILTIGAFSSTPKSTSNW